jgi:hypothetical protein
MAVVAPIRFRDKSFRDEMVAFWRRIMAVPLL